MTELGVYQLIIYLAVILILVVPLGWYMAQVYEGKPCGLDFLLRPIEKLIYRLCSITPEREMTWQTYLTAVLIFNLLGILAFYTILRLQAYLPYNPQGFAAVPPALSFNTATSFVTNTDWQAYSGETTLSYLTQMLALTVQNFLSAANGLAILVALIRGLARRETNVIGNFWVDMVRGTLYIFLPLALIFAVLLSTQGVIQNFNAYQPATLMEPIAQASQPITQQIIPMGPVASQLAITQLGTNGGGFFNTNAAHPFANPTPLSNFIEMIAILLIPAALCYTFGLMVKDRRQGFALLVAMLIMLIPAMLFAITSEQSGNPKIAAMGVAMQPDARIYAGGNMEGKETRNGIVSSAIWAVATTATSNGSVNSMHDSYLPFGGLMTLCMMHLGEVVFGGVGSGLYGMIMLVIITVFVAGLMVGRTPEYLGKKIEPYEMKMASFAVLIMPIIVLFFTGISVVISAGTSAISNPGPHGLSQILYAFTSMTNNNGSAFAGLSANTLFYNTTGGIAILIGRFWIVMPVLAIAGSLARKKIIPESLGTLQTHSVLFIWLLISVAILIGGLTFFPALALGPIVEHLLLWS